MIAVAPSDVRTSNNRAAARGIVWLASFPKSGNTWFRIFLRNLLTGRDDLPDSEEDLEEGPHGLGCGIASSRILFDDVAGIDSSDLSHDEIDRLRPRVYERIVEEAEQFPLFMKTHDAFTYLPDGGPLLSRSATAGAIYFVRNPLDVAVSYAYHSVHEDFDRTIAGMARRDDAMCGKSDRLFGQLRQQMRGWSGHVESWLAADVPVHLMRYEDMQRRPLEVFTAAARFAGLDHGEEQIAAALEMSRFDRLQRLEAENGFREKIPDCKSFFRKGEVGGWREKLNGEQAERIIAAHADAMRRLGYLDDEGRPAIQEIPT